MVAKANMQRIVGAVLLLVCIPATALPRSAEAATPPTFTVNSVFDVPADFTDDPNYDICRTNVANTTCTLRAAIMNANRFPGGGVTINIPSGTYRLTIAPNVFPDDDSTGDLNITNSMTINGASAASTVIDGNQIDRVFNEAPAPPPTLPPTPFPTPTPTPTYTGGGGITVTISNVTIHNGLTFGVGGGISNQNTLTVNDCVISGNQTTSGSAGAGIANSGTMTLNNTVVSGNITDGNAGGVYNDNFATLTIDGSIITANQTVSGGYGGGISNSGAMTINNTLIAANFASGKGGGIANFQGTLTQTNSTINANSAASDGGAIYNFATAIVTDSTISANAAGGNGGGIDQMGTLQLFHVTVAGNIAESSASGLSVGGGIFQAPGGSTNQIWNSLFAENYTAAVPNDCGGAPFTSEDYNYIQTIGTAPSCTVSGTTTHNVSGGDALLDALQDNGGQTPTRGLLTGSLAIDQIPPALCRDAFGTAPIPDQRGVPRPVGPLCDIGAFEGAVQPAVFGRNLVRNGGAENGAGSLSGAFVGVPNWQSRGGQLLTVVPYGVPGFPSATDATAPLTPGRNFFAGGDSAAAVAVQDIDLSAFATSIDAGTAAYDFSADLGGFADQEDNATVEADFLDQTSNLLMLTTLGPVTAADRGNVTGFLHQDSTGMMPAQTRTVELFITLTRVSGSYNDGYADNVSFVVTSTAPTPTAPSTPTESPTSTPTATATNPPTATPTGTPTPTPTGTATQTTTRTSTATAMPSTAATNTPSKTPTNTSTNTPTFTLTPTVTPSNTAMNTPTRTPTTQQTATVSPTSTPTVTSTNSPTMAPTLTATSTATPTVTNTSAPTPTTTPTNTPVETATSPPTLTLTATPLVNTPTMTPPVPTSTPTIVATATSSPPPGDTATPSPTPILCVGDCNGDGNVTVDEILTLVNIALGNTPASDCSAGVPNGAGQVTVDEIVVAVNNALNGCHGAS